MMFSVKAAVVHALCSVVSGLTGRCVLFGINEEKKIVAVI